MVSQMLWGRRVCQVRVSAWALGLNLWLSQCSKRKGADQAEEGGKGDNLAACEPGEAAGAEAGGEGDAEPGEAEGDNGDPHVDPGHLAVHVSRFNP